jgi:hypothetical protein
MGLGATGLLAGCAGESGPGSRSGPPTIEERPDAVYVPTHVEGMEMAGVAETGRLRIALSYSVAHPFWLLDGAQTNRVDVTDDDTIHLMATVWDAETNTAIPSSNILMSVSNDGDHVVEKRIWPMLSQNMGFHYGDNVGLEGDGTYQVDLQFGPVSTRTTGEFRDALEERAEPSFTLEVSQPTLDDLMYRRLEERAGEAGAVAPMEMAMLSVPQLPQSSALPGATLGDAMAGDARLVGRLLDAPPDGIDAGGSYIAVSARTPYNRYPLPFMALAATVTRDGKQLYDGALTETLDPKLGYHYGTAIDSEAIRPDDEVAITIQTVPQVARHEGYETAFLDETTVDI